MKKKRISLLLSAILILSLAGCGKEEVVSNQGTDITLIEPVNATSNYEKAAYRTIYDAQIYSATVVPYIEEYSSEYGMTFDHYGAFSGDTVKKGQTLLHSDSTDIDNQIKNMEEQIRNLEEGYLEYLSSMEEELAVKKQSLANLQGYMDAYNENPEAYDQAVADAQLLGPYRTLAHAIDTIELNMSQRAELYELDRKHYEYLLSELLKQKKAASVVSEMSGSIVALKSLSQGEYVPKDTPVVAVGDLSQRLLKCDYINASKINKASDIYAIIDGTRYELEYHPMEAEEYVRLNSMGQKVYTTFTLLDGKDQVQIGDFAVIALVNDVRDGILSVPARAIQKDDLGYFVYVKKDGTNQQVYIKTGVSDGVYTEILSGVAEGEEVMVETIGKTGKTTAVLKKGSFNTSYESSALMEYPSNSVLKNPIENGTVYYVGSELQPFAQINKGDVIASVRVEADQVALQRNETKRTRLIERIADLEELDSEANAKQIESMKEQLADLEEVIAKQKADFSATTIKADNSGVLISWARYEAEDILSPGSYLITLADEGTCFISTEDPNHLLQYGNKVTITYDTLTEKEKTVEGTVVSMSPVGVSSNLVSENAYIAVPADKVGEMSEALFAQRGYWNRYVYKVAGTVREMDNVVIVPKKAVTEIDGCTYVSVVQKSGEIVAQRFISGGYNADYYWVVDGLTEGMEICLE